MQEAKWLRPTSCTRQIKCSSFIPDPRKKQRRVNRCIIVSMRGKWTNEALEKAMDVIESGRTSLRQTNRHWNIFCTSLSYHLNCKTRSRKCGPSCVLREKEDEVVIAWTLTMQKVGLSITL
jgi:hypothetical protein